MCWFAEDDRTAVPRFLKVQGDLVYYLDEAYKVDPAYTRLVWYPTGMPSMFQTLVPCLLYQRGRHDPLDWVLLGAGPIVSAKEVGAALEKYWMGMIVRGVREGMAGASRMERMMTFLAVGLSALTLIMIFVVMTKMGSLQSAVSSLRP